MVDLLVGSMMQMVKKLKEPENPNSIGPRDELKPDSSEVLWEGIMQKEDRKSTALGRIAPKSSPTIRLFRIHKSKNLQYWEMDAENKPIKLKGQVSLFEVQACRLKYRDTIPSIQLETRDFNYNNYQLTFRFATDINPLPRVREEELKKLEEAMMPRYKFLGNYIRAVSRGTVAQHEIHNQIMTLFEIDQDISESVSIPLKIDKESVLPFLLASGYQESQFEDIFYVQYLKALLGNFQFQLSNNPGLLKTWKKAWRSCTIVILFPSDINDRPDSGTLYKTWFDDRGQLLIKFTPNMCATNLHEIGSDLLANTQPASYYDNLIAEEHRKANERHAKSIKDFREAEDRRNLAKIAKSLSKR